ncbi:hypothetical protein Scep_030637 [Stephania cephalantha]|uniref:Uncharacterized protein n=1 Tax=Stephania cephalantha TaxID=152367 RepID=A0AAP0HH38_9MAGN
MDELQTVEELTKFEDELESLKNTTTTRLQEIELQRTSEAASTSSSLCLIDCGSNEGSMVEDEEINALLGFYDPGSTTTTNSKKLRSRPLQTCAFSFISLAAKVVGRAEQVGGPVCFLAKKISKFSHPVVSTMQYQWLLILSYADDQNLAIETVVEKCFPFATHVLDKLDAVVAVSEAVPDKIDNAIDELSAMIHRKVPILSGREALVDVQDESELIMIDSSHAEDTIEESSDRTIKDKDVLREFDDE